jgi:hypothetical protein
MPEIITNDYPECPYCGHKADAGCAPEETESSDEIVQCDGCGLHYVCDVSVSYTCTTLDLEEAQENTESVIANFKSLSIDVPESWEEKVTALKQKRSENVQMYERHMKDLVEFRIVPTE